MIVDTHVAKSTHHASFFEIGIWLNASLLKLHWGDDGGGVLPGWNDVTSSANVVQIHTNDIFP